MKKITALLLVLLLAPLIAGLYGILHDQLTYTISPEYYTRFKFEQFNLGDAAELHPRAGAMLVGVLATWWMGIPIGLILGLAGLRHKNGKQTFRVTMSALMITLIVAFCTGLIGWIYGQLFVDVPGFSWWLPQNLEDTKSFLVVGTMHNFSYFGGLLGLIAGIVYSVRQRKNILAGNQ